MSLIGVNGMVGAGKDTVALASIWLYNARIEFDKFDYPTLEEFKKFEQKFNNHSHAYNVEIKKFATALRKVAEILTGVDHWRFEDRDFKENYFRNNLTGEILHRNALPKNATIVEDYQSAGYELNSWIRIRVYLQDLGTDAIRSRDQEAWVNALFAKFNPDKDIWAISDMRFPNEYNKVKSKKGYTIRTVRPKTDRTDYENLHPSETALINYKFDCNIINDGPIEYLFEQLDSFLKTTDFYGD